MDHIVEMGGAPQAPLSMVSETKTQLSSDGCGLTGADPWNVKEL